MSQKIPRRLDRVLSLIREHTLRAADARFEDYSGLTASGVAEAAGLNRANASKELNRLYRQGLVIKCQGKPTLFLHRSALSLTFPHMFFPSTIPCGEHLADYLTARSGDQSLSQKTVLSLESVIGGSGSMKQAVMQARAAVLYPPRGIHTLITGKAGIGKLRFAKIMYEFARSCSRAAPDGKFVILNCQDYSGSPQVLMSQIFGYGKSYLPGAQKGRLGLIEQARGGILCLNEVHKLPPKVQELLTTLIEKNTFCRMGESSVVREGEAMIIATTTEPADSPSIERFVHNMPMLITLPDLTDRGPGELLEHLALFFCRESTHIQLPLRIHKDVAACLLQAPYPGQIGELKGCVKGISSLAYLDYITGGRPSSAIEISYRHLSPTVTAAVLPDGKKTLQIQRLLDRLQGEYLTFSPGEPPQLPLYSHISGEVVQDEPLPLASNEPPKLPAVGNYINRCIDRMQNAPSADKERICASFPAFLRQSVDRVLDTAPRYRTALGNPKLYYGLLLHLYNVPAPGEERLLSSADTACREDIRRTNPKEYMLAQRLQEELAENGSKPISDSELPFIAMYLYLSVNWTAEGNVRFLAMFHGDGVSAGVAGYLNSVVRLPLVQGIDCGPGISVGQVLEQAVAAAQSVDHSDGLLIFTDMAPFTDLNRHLSEMTGIRTERIAGATMPLMLRMVEKSASEHCSLMALMSEAPGSGPQDQLVLGAVTSSFLNRIIHEILSPSLTFLNPGKAADVLLNILHGILSSLFLGYSDEIAVKFIFHSAHMLERVIKGEPLKYPRLKAFINSHPALMGCIDRHLVCGEEVFGVPVPASEKAYIAEIFLPYQKTD